MAELKKANDYQYEPYETPMAPNSTPQPDQQEPKRNSSYESAKQVPISPARHLKRLSKMEKFLLSFVLLAIVGVSVFTIQLRTLITQVESEISSIQAETATKESEAVELEQEKNELNRDDRIKEIAERHGLGNHEDNLRKVN